MPQGRLLLQTIRSHDQFNTTIYGKDDRYRGVRGGRRVVFVHADDLADRGLADGDLVDIVSEFGPPGSAPTERRAEWFRAVAYPTARGCVAAYFPPGERPRAGGLLRQDLADAGVEIRSGAVGTARRAMTAAEEAAGPDREAGGD